MPSKKPNKAAKRPGKATPKKATHKVAAPKKVVRPPAKAKPSLQTSKVTVKPNKPAPKPVIAKPAAVRPVPVKAPRPKPEPVVVKVASEKIAPIKFDTRPLVMTRVPQSDDAGRRTCRRGYLTTWNLTSPAGLPSMKSATL